MCFEPELYCSCWHTTRITYCVTERGAYKRAYHSQLVDINATSSRYSFVPLLHIWQYWYWRWNVVSWCIKSLLWKTFLPLYLIYPHSSLFVSSGWYFPQWIETYLYTRIRWRIQIKICCSMLQMLASLINQQLGLSGLSLQYFPDASIKYYKEAVQKFSPLFSLTSNLACAWTPDPLLKA